MLYLLGGAKRWRRGTLRFQEESGRIEAWLAKIESLAADNYLVAVQLAKAQRLVKGYGETHERGWRNFTALLGQVDLLAGRSDGGSVLARLIEAALADEEGTRLRSEIAALGPLSAPPAIAAPGVAVARSARA
jgi:indolepyruvate ferredoxin oxidoreductase beta subunit